MHSTWFCSSISGSWENSGVQRTPSTAQQNRYRGLVLLLTSLVGFSPFFHSVFFSLCGLLYFLTSLFLLFFLPLFTLFLCPLPFILSAEGFFNSIYNLSTVCLIGVQSVFFTHGNSITWGSEPVFPWSRLTATEIKPQPKSAHTGAPASVTPNQTLLLCFFGWCHLSR